MTAATVHFDTADVMRGFDQLARPGRAIARALNRTAASARTVLTKDVSEDMALRQATVREQIRITQADEDHPTATVSVRGARIPLIEFGARGPEPSRGKGRGVSYSTGRGRRRLPHAFIATMRSGHRGVFERHPTKVMRTQRQGRKPRPAIVEKFGPSLPHVFAKHLPAGAQRAGEQLLKNLEHELAFALSQE